MYTPEAVAGFVEDSLRRMGLERLDMILLHCPPASVFARDDIFGELERQKRLGKIAGYGVSIEKVSEGIQAMEYGIAAMEVIFNNRRREGERRGDEGGYLQQDLRQIISHPFGHACFSVSFLP